MPGKNILSSQQLVSTPQGRQQCTQITMQAYRMASSRAVALLLAAPPNPWVARPAVWQPCARQCMLPRQALKGSRPNSTGPGSRNNGQPRRPEQPSSRGSSSSSSQGMSSNHQPGSSNFKSGSRNSNFKKNQQPPSGPRRDGSSSKAHKDSNGKRGAPEQSGDGGRGKDLGYKATPQSSALPDHVALLVVGGGAAGLTAAYFAAKAGAQVCVLERTREAGKKILMSGGTRCNVLPQEADLQLDYITGSSQSALRAVFASWTLDQCHDWLSQEVGLQLMLEAETRKWFPASNSGRQVRDRLVAACEALGVSFVYNASVEQILPPTKPQDQQHTPPAKQLHHHHQQQQQPLPAASKLTTSSSNSRWRVGLASGATVSADRVIVSTGGRSFPVVGTDGTGLQLLQGLGHGLSQGGCYAALTPLKGRHPGGEQLAGLTLAGVRLSVTKPSSNKVVAAAQRGGLLFTHKGYSGPAILDLSHWMVKALEQQPAGHPLPRLLVDWSGEGDEVWQQRLAGAPGGLTVERLLRKHGIKERLAAALAVEVGVVNKPLSQLKKNERQQLLTALTAWPLPIEGHEGYGKAEVTGGGVPLEQVDCKTMESRVQPGLYLCGEVLDVFGRIGGFNFWWAWLSGRIAGQAAGAAAAQHKQQQSQQSVARAG